MDIFGRKRIAELESELREEKMWHEYFEKKYTEAQQPKPRRWYIPEDKLEAFYKMREKCEVGMWNKAVKYQYWKYIYGLFPDLKKDGSYRANLVDIMQPYIEEDL